MVKTLGSIALLVLCGCIATRGQSPNTPAAGSVTGAPVVIRSSDAESASPAKATTSTGVVATSSTESAPSAPAAPPPQPTDFELFVSASVGHSLPIFGTSLFSSGGKTFSPSSAVAPPADYVIGTGDQIIIRTSGKIDIDVTATVDRDGHIFIPRIGTLTVAGLRLDRLTDFIRAEISRQFTGFELSVSLGQLRSIQVFVLGYARAPGVYTISSLSTLVNALFFSGGPSALGTMRDIQVKRGGEILTHFDVYKLIVEGDKSADVRLLPGDIIYIPPVGPLIAVDGDVGSPAIYELVNGATVGSAISNAGGLTPVAGTARAILEHVVDHSQRTIEEFPLDAKGLATPMHNADILRLFPLSPQIRDAVTIRGNVAQPGRYAWHAGMRISDLIPSRDTLLSRNYYNQQNALDVQAGQHPFGGALPTSTPATATHDTEINWNYAVIQRLNHSDLTTDLIPFALGRAIDDPSSAENKQLQAGDVIVVYTRNDVALPVELQAKFVRIDGQVTAPGEYRIGPDETLRDLVAKAGGLAPHSYLYASKLTRDSLKAEQAEQIKEFAERESRELLAPSNQRLGLSGTPVVDLESRRAYLELLTKVQPDGRVVLNLRPDANQVAEIPNIRLEDGDHYFIPTVPNTVDVLGAVYNQVSLSAEPNRRNRLYLDDAGGATRDADPKREFIIRANGMVVSRQNASNFPKLPLYPGDALIVPPKMKSAFSLYDFTNLTQFISTFGLVAVALTALR